MNHLDCFPATGMDTIIYQFLPILIVAAMHLDCSENSIPVNLKHWLTQVYQQRINVNTTTLPLHPHFEADLRGPIDLKWFRAVKAGNQVRL